MLGLTPVIQAPKQGLRTMRYELADYEWTAIKPMRGDVVDLAARGTDIH